MSYVRQIWGLIATAVVAIALTVAAPASAVNWTNTSLTLSDATPSATNVTYTFTIQGSSTTTVACVLVNWYVNSDGTGGSPAGFNVQGATWSNASTWLTVNGWNVNKQPAEIRATQQYGGAPAANGTLILTGVTNASSSTTSYAKVKTYTDQNCTSSNLVDTATFATTSSAGGTSSTGNATLTVTVGSTFSLAIDGYNGATCNGAALTSTGSTGLALPVGTISPTKSGVVAQTLTVHSSATNGYSVTVKHSGLTDGSGHTVAPFSATNGSPAAMSGAGTEGIGYSTEWITLNAANGTANRFAGNKWAGLAATGGEVMYRASGATTSPGDTTHVCYQVGMSNLTTAGSYTDTITYTATPSF